MSVRIAEPELHARVKKLIAQHHRALAHWGVTVSVLVSDKPLRHHGAAAAAIVRISPPRERAQGCADATITLCGATWETREPETQDAILDHELTHLVVQTRPARARDNGKPGELEDGALDGFMAKLDDDDRPKLKIRPHDHQFGWFEEVAERHGAASLEVQQAQQLAVGTTGQVFWLAALPGAPTLAATGTDDATVTFSVVGGPSVTLPQAEMERRLKTLAARERKPKATRTHGATRGIGEVIARIEERVGPSESQPKVTKRSPRRKA